MGQAISDTFNRFVGKKKVIVPMIGYYLAGKSTILYKIKTGEVLYTIPTNITFNIETIKYKNIDFELWDLGYTCQGLKLSFHYMEKTDGIIFVVDSTDREFMKDVKEVLDMTLGFDKFKDKPLLVFANKQDLPNAMTCTEIANKLCLDSLTGKRRWHVQKASAHNGTGLYEGLDWLYEVINLK